MASFNPIQVVQPGSTFCGYTLVIVWYHNDYLLVILHQWNFNDHFFTRWGGCSPGNLEKMAKHSAFADIAFMVPVQTETILICIIVPARRCLLHGPLLSTSTLTESLAYPINWLWFLILLLLWFGLVVWKVYYRCHLYLFYFSLITDVQVCSLPRYFHCFVVKFNQTYFSVF